MTVVIADLVIAMCVRQCAPMCESHAGCHTVRCAVAEHLRRLCEQEGLPTSDLAQGQRTLIQRGGFVGRAATLTPAYVAHIKQQVKTDDWKKHKDDMLSLAKEVCFLSSTALLAAVGCMCIAIDDA